MDESSYKILKIKASELPPQYNGMVRKQFRISLRGGNDYLKLIDPNVYYDIYPKYIATILDRPQSLVKIAVLTDNEDVVLGWSLSEPDKIHYVFVHKDNRKIGIAKSLVTESFSQFSHITNIGLSIWHSKFPKATFNPFC